MVTIKSHNIHGVELSIEVPDKYKDSVFISRCKNTSSRCEKNNKDVDGVKFTCFDTENDSSIVFYIYPDGTNIMKTYKSGSLKDRW
jgi:hypothetical protein